MKETLAWCLRLEQLLLLRQNMGPAEKGRRVDAKAKTGCGNGKGDEELSESITDLYALGSEDGQTRRL